MQDEELVTAAELQRRGILKAGVAYLMARAGVIPCYAVGIKKRGVRFLVPEVLAALRRPTASPEPAEVKVRRGQT